LHGIELGDPTVLVIRAEEDPALRGEDALSVVQGIVDAAARAGDGDPVDEISSFIEQRLPDLAGRSRRNLVRSAAPLVAHLALPASA